MQSDACPLRFIRISWLLGLILALAAVGCRQSVTKPTLAAQVSDDAVVWIVTQPAGADVVVQDAAQGQTPLKLKLASGSHELRVSKTGYATRDLIVTAVASDVHTVTAELRDILPPRLDLEVPETAVLAHDGLKIDAQAEDNEVVQSLRLYLDGALCVDRPGDRLIHNLDTRELSVGRHELRVVAHDAAGNSTEDQAQFEVLAPPTARPTVEPSVTASPTVPDATANPSAAVTATAQPQVVVWWDELTIPTVGYKAGLYAAPERAGHPYPLLDRGAMTPVEPISYRALYVRNSYLELVFLPDLGGRLYQARFLPTGQDLFWTAPVIKPTHWGPPDQGWWLAVGGMEWCLPVDEHGYLTAEPWDVVPLQRDDGGVTVRASVVESTRNMHAQVDVTLLPEEMALRITTRLENPNDAPISYQYWMNAILSPGAPGIEPDLQFVVPADQVVVHSTGDDALPGEHGVMAWPEHEGRDMRIYGNWRNWLGFFVTQPEAPFTAVYSPEAALGVVRAYPPEVARGAKLFAFARDFGDVGAYTDDGTHYVEMWGGVTPTFWDYATLGAGEALQWEETWWVLADSHVPCAARADVSLTARGEGDLLAVSVTAPSQTELYCRVVQGEQELFGEAVALEPGTPWTKWLPVSSGQRDIIVQLLDAQGEEVLQCAP